MRQDSASMLPPATSGSGVAGGQIAPTLSGERNRPETHPSGRRDSPGPDSSINLGARETLMDGKWSRLKPRTLAMPSIEDGKEKRLIRVPIAEPEPGPSTGPNFPTNKTDEAQTTPPTIEAA